MLRTPSLLALALACAVAATAARAESGAPSPRAGAEASPGAAPVIRRLLADQVDAWNRGDIPAFMEAYVKTDALRFASGGTITHGWQPTLDRYLKRYPDRAAMGTLAFTIHDIDLLAPDAAVVFGQWELARTADRPRGLFTLVLRRTPDGWRIASDHTSSATP